MATCPKYVHTNRKTEDAHDLEDVMVAMMTL
jgi:hypothetical protein